MTLYLQKDWNRAWNIVFVRNKWRNETTFLHIHRFSTKRMRAFLLFTQFTELQAIESFVFQGKWSIFHSPSLEHVSLAPNWTNTVKVGCEGCSVYASSQLLLVRDGAGPGIWSTCRGEPASDTSGFCRERCTLPHKAGVGCEYRRYRSLVTKHGDCPL